MNEENRINRLRKKGVKILNPQTVHIGDDVNLDQISGEKVTLFGGCRISGKSTVISENVRIGYEGPITIENCQVGSGVDLKGGFFKDAVFLNGASMGSGAHVREGTILEEEASGAHTVGLKQTILFPYVTLGSLINFCDCLMAGGTNRKNHSEVGSSYIHFNFTPYQDKATPSLIGDVPNGVMLRQKPIFLGGQGGMVGPCRISYGTVIAAGSVCRKDEVRPDRLILFQETKPINVQFTPGYPKTWKRILLNNLIYIANLMALMHWYQNVRYRFISDELSSLIFKGLVEKLNMGIDERIRRLKEFAVKITLPGTGFMGWELLDMALNEKRTYEGEIRQKELFLKSIERGIQLVGKSYISVIQQLESADVGIGTGWLQGIVDHIISTCKIQAKLDLKIG